MIVALHDRSRNNSFAACVIESESWIKASDTPKPRGLAESGFSARLTTDVKPDLRGRIQIATFHRDVALADTLSELLAPKFPATEGDQS